MNEETPQPPWHQKADGSWTLEGARVHIHTDDEGKPIRDQPWCLDAACRTRGWWATLGAPLKPGEPARCPCGGEAE